MSEFCWKALLRMFRASPDDLLLPGRLRTSLTCAFLTRYRSVPCRESRLEAPVTVTVCDDRDAVERDLGERRICCPWCAAGLARWGELLPSAVPSVRQRARHGRREPTHREVAHAVCVDVVAAGHGALGWMMTRRRGSHCAAMCVGHGVLCRWPGQVDQAAGRVYLAGSFVSMLPSAA